MMKDIRDVASRNSIDLLSQTYGNILESPSPKGEARKLSCCMRTVVFHAGYYTQAVMLNAVCHVVYHVAVQAHQRTHETK